MAKSVGSKQHFTVVLSLVISILAAFPAFPQSDPGAIQGSVVSIESGGVQSVVPGAKVILRSEGTATSDIEAVAGVTGRFLFSGVAPGAYRISAATPEMASEELTVNVRSGETVNLDIELKLRPLKQSITVDAASAEVAMAAGTVQGGALSQSTLQNAPNHDERFESLLPLIPGVVRGPDGLINMKGVRSSQNGLLVNSANVTDPVTGGSGINLPIDVISSAQVVANPYDAEYGKLTGAVTVVETRVSNFDKFHFRMQNFLPRPRFRDGSAVGVESSTPRMTITGPLLHKKVAITQSLEYRYVRTPVNSLPPMKRDTELESLDSYTQIDLNLTERQSAFVTISFYPEKLRYFGLNSFTTQAATPDLHQRGHFLAFSHKLATQSGGLLASQVSYKTLDGDLKPQSNDPYELGVETTTGGFYNRQHRETGRFEWQEVFSPRPTTARGQHQLKFGGDFVHNAYDGQYTSLPIEVLRASGMLAERIDFSPGVSTSVRQEEYTAFAQDKWKLNNRATLDGGLRFDHDSISDKAHVAPRLGIAVTPFAGERTIIRSGLGFFYDRINLNIPTFTRLPDRTQTTYLANGSLAGALTYQNRLGGSLDNPRSIAWNAEIEQRVQPGLVIRVGYSQRVTTRDFILEPQQSAYQATLWLSNGGWSRYREFQVAARYQVAGNVVNASYVRSRAVGDLNDFNQFFGNTPNPIIRANQRSLLAFDAPNRFLFWGELRAPWKITFSPVLDIHTGFPYSIVDEERDFIGVRNRAGRFPEFVSADLQATKEVRIPFFPKKYKALVGVRVFNIFNHYNPRDLQANTGSYRYGALLNNVNRTLRGKLVVEF